VITLEALRKIDPQMRGLADSELEDVRRSFYEFGQLMFDDWKEQKFGSKNPVGSLTNKLDENTI